MRLKIELTRQSTIENCADDMDKEELQRRTKQYALNVLHIVDALPRTSAGRAIGNQLLRSATSVGANYRAACRARSRAEFAAKIGIVIEEADESGYWLELIIDGTLLNDHDVIPLLQETNELVAIFVTTRKTTQQTTSSIINLKS
ncbi:MAG: four helix bundle protein [Candidatus Uhrbacteria bacterium]